LPAVLRAATKVARTIERWHHRQMSRKPTSNRKPPSTSKLERPRPLAYARRQKTGSDVEDDKDRPADTQGAMPIGEQLAALAKPDEAKSAAMKSDKEEAKPAATKPDGSKIEGAQADGAKADGSKTEGVQADGAKADGSKADGSKADGGKAEGSKADGGKAEGSKPDGGKASAKTDTSKPDDDAATRSKRTTETPVLEQPDVDPWRSRADTQLMPPLTNVGAPPAVPAVAPAMPAATGGVEEPTFMPGPRDVPAGNPNDPAPAPGRVPRGDSRSLRRENEFALVYRVGTFVISRFGTVGTRGQWRVVEYPTSNAASHAYAKESSRFVSEGFSDYRDY
jgi:hypothetical protein